MKIASFAPLLVCVLEVGFVTSGEWTQFRGPGGLGVSDATDLPVTWSSNENIAWKTDLPGPGSSSPVVVEGHVYLTCDSGYGFRPNEGNKDNLMRHVVCVDRQTGRIAWSCGENGVKVLRVPVAEQ